MDDRLVSGIEPDVRRIQMLSCERWRERLELTCVRRVGNLDLELRLLCGEVVRLLNVVDARQLEQDLVVANGLDDRLGNAETVDAAVDDPSRAVVVVGHALAGGDLVEFHLKEELRATLQVEPEVGLDLLVHLEGAEVQAHAGAARGKWERELMLRDVDEDRQQEDNEDEPGARAVHKRNSRG